MIRSAPSMRASTRDAASSGAQMCRYIRATCVLGSQHVPRAMTQWPSRGRAPDVLARPRREPGRDRRPGDPRAARARRRGRRGLLDRGRRSQHVRMADHAVRVGPPAAGESYLRIPNVIAAAVTTGCQAVHPGYGFLAENPAFVEACVENDLVFVGPPADVMAMMGDKISAKQAMRARRRPDGAGHRGRDDRRRGARAAADEMGYPILLKASAGGGGKGMRLVQSSEASRGRVRRGGGRGAGGVRRPAALRREGGRRRRVTSRSRCSATTTATC